MADHSVWGLFGDFSTALLWGTGKCSDVYNNNLSYTSSVKPAKTSLGSLAFRGFMGIKWETDINAKKSHFTTKLGYEMQFWLNQLRINTFQLQRLQADLTIQGITVCCQFDFKKEKYVIIMRGKFPFFVRQRRYC